MKDNELIQALRVCAFGNCDKCSRVKINGPKCINDLQQIAADRLANKNTHILALQKEIEGLRKQNQQLREASALLTAESAALLERRWIPVTERLPKLDEQVLVIASGKPLENLELINALELATLYADGWCLETWPEWQGAIVTHWMPLPPAPEVEKTLEAKRDG